MPLGEIDRRPSINGSIKNEGLSTRPSSSSYYRRLMSYVIRDVSRRLRRRFFLHSVFRTGKTTEIKNPQQNAKRTVYFFRCSHRVTNERNCETMTDAVRHIIIIIIAIIIIIKTYYIVGNKSQSYILYYYFIIIHVKRVYCTWTCPSAVFREHDWLVDSSRDTSYIHIYIYIYIHYNMPPLRSWDAVDYMRYFDKLVLYRYNNSVIMVSYYHIPTHTIGSW